MSERDQPGQSIAVANTFGAFNRMANQEVADRGPDEVSHCAEVKRRVAHAESTIKRRSAP